MKLKKFIISIFMIILIFFSFETNVNASIFTAEEDFKGKNDIEETIDKDEGGLFEKIIAKIIRRSC